MGGYESAIKEKHRSLGYTHALCFFYQTNSGQSIGVTVEGAVEMCGNQIAFQQGFKDARRVAELVGGRWSQEIKLLPKRRYVGMLRIQDVPRIVSGRTKALPDPNHKLAAEILAQSQQGPTRDELLAGIRSRRVERGGAGRGGNQSA